MSVSKDENAEETGKVLNNCAYVEQDKTEQYAFNQNHSLDKKVIKSTKATDGVKGSMTVDEKRKEDVSKASKVVSSKTKDLKNTSERGTPEKGEQLHPKESENETTIKKSKQATNQASKDSDTKNMPQSKKHTPVSEVKGKRSGQNLTRQPPEIARKDISKTKTKLSMSRITDEKFKPTVARSSIASDSKLISKSKFKDSNANLKRDNLGSNTSLTVNHIKDRIKTKHIESKLKERGDNTDLHMSEPSATIDTTITPETRTHRPISYIKIDKNAPKLSQQDSHHSNVKIKHIFEPRTTPADLDSKDTFGKKTSESNSNKCKIQPKHTQPSKPINSKDISEQQSHHLKTTLKWKKSESITSETPTAFGSRNKIQRKTQKSKLYTTENKNEADIKRSSSPAFVDKEKSKTKTDPSKNISKESNCSPSLTPKSIKEIDDKETQKIRAKAKLNDTERTSITTHKQKISVMKDKSVTPSSVSHLLTNKTSDVDTSKLAGECNTQKAPYLTTSSPSPAQFQQSMSISKSPVTKENQITSKGNDTIKVPRDGLSINSKNNELPLKKQRSNTRLENGLAQTEIKTSKSFKQSFLQRKECVKSEKDLQTETTVKRNETSEKCMIHETKIYFDENSQDKSPERDRATESERRGCEISKTVIKNVENFETLHKISTPEREENESGGFQNNLIGENRIVKTDSGENADLSNQEIKLEDIGCNIVESGVCLSLKKDIHTAFNLESSNKTAETTSRPSSINVVDKCRDDGNSRNINTKRSESSADKNYKKNGMPTDFDDFTGHNKHFSPNAKIDNFSERDEKQNSNKNTYKSQPNEKRPKLFSFQKISPSDKKSLFNGQKESRIEKHAFLKSKPVSQGSSSIQSTVEIGGARLKTKSNLQLQNYAKGPCQRKQSETADITPAVIEMAFLKDLMYKESSIIVDELLNNRQFLDYYIDMATKDENAIDLFLQVLSKAFETHDLKIILQLFEYLKTKGLFDKIIDCLLHVIIQIKTKETAGTYIQRILENILIIQIAHLTRNPSSYRTFRKLQAVICQVIEELANIGSCNDEVYAKYERLSEYMRAIEKDRKQTFKSEEKREPPDDFRHYPTSPTIDEITSVTKPFLRPVKVTGSYENLHDYLDVHFRLLREDFVGPLRDGITGLIKIMSAYKGKATTSERLKELDMKIYENVRVLSPVVTQQGLCYKMKLQMTPNLRNIEWKFSKRLIYGSMVCLTDKDFTEFFLATVVEREVKDIGRGYFVVHFETQNVDMKSLHRKMFIMAETSGYFEAYRHVLSSLKTCKDGDLPFEKYIVNCKESIGYPAYLNQNHKYDLRPLVDQDVKLKAKRRLIKNKVLAVSNDIEFSLQSYPAGEVHLTRLRNWPNKELLRMDGSQYRAVQSALTRELAIIQGPPGTGKTYIGLQIVKTLLHNKSSWTKTGQKVKPMLIVCYTNHALDQFLEGILKFYKGDILRVGGRSNSADLEEYNLKEYRQIKFKKNSSLATLQFNKRVSRRNMDAQSRCVQNLAKRIQLFQSEIVNEDTLSKEIGDRLFKSLKADFKGNVKQANFSYIVKWLGVEYMKKECVKELRKARNVRKVKHVRVEDEIARTLQERMLDFDADTNFSSIEGLIVRKIRNDDIAFYVEESKGKTRRRKNEPSKEQELDKLFNKTFKTTLMAKITDEDVMSQEEADTIQNVWRLNHKTKWRLYRLWIKKKCTALYEKIEEEKANFEATSESYRDALQQVDKAIMQKAVVIGMTTSGAARYQSVLREIGPKIIVVEEAAEVLEAHIITTLSNKCEHLILIGDHKQLRPNPTVYELVVKYNLDISLFERMVKNGIEFNCLELQHRMRPEISSIMRHIYPDLKDHEHVRSYPNVKGVSTNLFLVNHSHMEICSNEIKSYSNPKEAEYAVALCRYLLLQGYQKDEITILTTYSGQLMYFRNLMSEEEFDGVHVTVVDNYQGEENQIVILSLVRSNKNAKIGFLKTENRICVALSRAKVGLFIIANFDHLASQSSLWERITTDMKNKNNFGEGLVLYCQNHPNDDAIVAIKAEDFQKAPEGGCLKKCDTRLKCGHKCVHYCHVIDKEHNEIKCKKPCTKILCDLGHKCPDKCFIECSPCQVLVTKIIPECGHTQLVPCATKPEDYCCQETCSKFLECSHMCKEKCGEEHTTECHEKVQFIWPCGHSYEIKCLETKTKACPQPCGLQLKCKHTCSGTCASCFNGRMHQQCRHECSVTHPCGHKSSALCQHNSLCTEPCENRCSHKKCRKKCGEVCTPCMLPCSWKCIHKRCTRRCGEICNRTACNFPCENILTCKHKCIGLCGEPCPSICRHCNYIKFKAMTFGKKQKQNAHYVLLEQCGHLIEYQAMDTMVKKQTKSKEIRCPKCTTIIKHCLRYGNIIKTFLSTIESSKKIAIGNLHLRYRLSGSITDIPEESESDSRIYAEIKQGTISEDVARTKYTSHFYKLFCKKELGYRLDSLIGLLITERQLLTIEKQWKICINVSDLIQRINDTEHDMCDSEKGNNFVSFLHKLITIVVQPRSVLTDQENEDIDREIRRGKTYLKFLKIGMSAIPMSVAAKIRENFIAIETVLLGSTLYTDELDSNVNKSIGCLSAEIEMYNQ